MKYNRTFNQNADPEEIAELIIEYGKMSLNLGKREIRYEEFKKFSENFWKYFYSQCEVTIE